MEIGHSVEESLVGECTEEDLLKSERISIVGKGNTSSSRWQTQKPNWHTFRFIVEQWHRRPQENFTCTRFDPLLLSNL